MPRHRSSSIDDERDRTIAIRGKYAEEGLLDRVARSDVYKLARRGSVAREALHCGLAELRADVAQSATAK